MTCIFCEIAAGRSPADMIFEDADVMVFMSLDGHPLVVPKAHVAALADLAPATGGAMMQAAVRLGAALRSATGCEGVNLILSDGAVAGQDVFHLHLHVVPRVPNDDVTLTWDTSVRPAKGRADLARALSDALGEAP